MMLSEDDFVKGMAILMAAYPAFNCPLETVDVYRDSLCHRLTPQEWEYAVNYHKDSCKWFPAISELLQAAMKTLPSAEEVWQWLLKAAEQGEEPEMDGATRQALMAVGGWEEFNRTSYESLSFRFKDFRAAYQEGRKAEMLARGAQPQIEHQGQGKTLELERPS